MMRIILAAILSLAMLGAAPGQGIAQDAPRTMIVMDGSGSMWGRIGKAPKLRIAKRAVNQLMKRLPSEMEVGLMAYGHRTEGDCGDIQVLVQPQANSDGKIRKALAGMKFQGKTPLASALREAAEAMGYQDGPVTVVMVTDGLESCRMDPCEVARDLEGEGFDFTAHVIGFGLKPKEGARLACIAKQTGGKYFPARNARALARALVAAVTGEDMPNMLDQVNPDAEVPLADAEVPMADQVMPEAGVPKVDVPVVEVPTADVPVVEPDVDVAAVDPAPDGTSSKQKKIAATPEVAVAEPEVQPEATEPVADMAAISVTVTPKDLPAGIAVAWTATPLDDPAGVVITSDSPVAGAWDVELTAGEWAIEGLADGYVFEDYVTVSATTTAFEVDGFATGADETAADDSADMEGDEGVVDEAAVDAPAADVAVPEEAVVEEPAPDAPAMDEPAADLADMMPIDPAVTLALPGAGTTTDAGYRCDAAEACGMQDAATGLVFALPPGWATDVPTRDGASQKVVMTLFGPEGADGSVPSLILNPASWSAGQGACMPTPAGDLCVWGQGDAATQSAAAVIAPSVIVRRAPSAKADAAPVAEAVAEPEVVEPEVVEPSAPVPLAEGGLVPADGTWAATVALPVITQCPAGIETGLDPVAASLTSARAIVWGGVFDPAKIGLEVSVPAIAWQSVSATVARGEVPPAPIPGQPPFVRGVIVGDFSLTDPETITGQLSLGAFADGVGTVNLLNAGLAQCRVTADVTMVRTGD